MLSILNFIPNKRGLSDTLRRSSRFFGIILNTDLIYFRCLFANQRNCVRESAMNLRFSWLLIVFITWACQGPRSLDSASHLVVANGKKVVRSDPYAGALVALVKNGSVSPGSIVPYCTGVLISPTAVVTAAHCIEETEVSTVFGLGLASEPTVLMGRAIKHEQYGADYNESFSFDLALILLSRNAPTSAKPLSLAGQQDYRIGDRGTLAGYGEVAKDTSDPRPKANQGIPFQTELRIKDIFKRGDENIRDDVSHWGLITSTSGDRRSGGCEGDSGGPLIVWQGGIPLLAAVVNGSMRGRSCDTETIFTNLDFYQEWIRKNTRT